MSNPPASKESLRPDPPRRRPVPLALPPGVTPEAWEWERDRHQNARLRALIGCLELLEEAAEPDIAVLNASARKLLELRADLLRVSTTLAEELLPHLGDESMLPDLDVVRREVRASFDVLDGSALESLRALAGPLRDRDLVRLRRVLCEARHELEDFLRQSFGRLVSTDPRSRHDVDYFLSRRFARDLTQDESLRTAIVTFLDELLPLARRRVEDLLERAAEMEARGRVPSRGDWPRTIGILLAIRREIVPRLRALVAHGGVRLDEVATLERFAEQMPVTAGVADRLFAVAERLAGGGNPASESPTTAAGEALHGALVGELAPLLRELDEQLHDLELFVRHWAGEVSARKAVRWGGS